MDFNQVVEFLRSEATVITGAPILAIALTFAGMAVGWLIAKHIYGERIDTKDAHIALLEATLTSERGAREFEKTPQPTPEMFHADVQARRAEIEGWRNMVGYSNNAYWQPGSTRSLIAIMEGDPRFLSLRPRLSEKLLEAIMNHQRGDESPNGILPVLRDVLAEIDALEKRVNFL